MNEYINACRNNKYGGAKFKRDVEEVIGWAIIEAKAKKQIHPTDKPCKVNIEWHERTRKRDPDNIVSAKKYILDELQRQGIIINDNQKYIKGFNDDIIESNRDYVVVELIEINN